jgi:hypothetical protein
MGSGPTMVRRRRRRLLETFFVFVALFVAGLVTAGVVSGAGPLAMLSDDTSTDTETTATDTTGTDTTSTDTTATDTTSTDTTATDTTSTETTETETTDTETTDTTTTDATLAWPEATEPYLVKFASGTSTDAQADVLAAAGAESQSYIRALRIHSVLLPGGDSLQVSLDVLDDSPSVTRVEADREREVGGTPDDSQYGDQWSLPLIGWENAFGTVNVSGSARVAILDTGVDGSHTDLNVVPGTSILDGSDGLSDPNGHGTAMAGIVAAKTNNGTGVAGVAYAGVQVMPVVVLGSDGTGQDSDIIEGVVYAADHGADVILMAFSNPGYSELLQEAIDYAWDEGAVLVAATGNDGSSSVTFPAGDRGVIGVSNTDQSDALNGSSNYGQEVFLGAPGTSIATTSAGGGYGSITGTSASAAEVAGAAALLSAASGASNGVIVSRLAKNAEAVGTREQTGNGRLNLDRAVTDTSTDSLKPAGADPVGSGGPFVGPYVAAARNFTVNVLGTGTGQVAIGVSAGTVSFATSGSNACTGTGNNTTSVTITATCTSLSSSSNGATITITATGLSGSTVTGFTGTGDFAGCTASACSAVLASSSNQTVTVTFTGNSAPAGTDKTITINEDATRTFAAADFGYTDSNAGDAMSAVRIDSLPAAGSLKLSGSTFSVPQLILTANIPNLTFQPAANASGSPYTSFTFSVRDTNGPLFDPSPNTITFNVTPLNDPPVAGTVAITPSSATAPRTNDTLTATPAGFTDADGDSLTYHYTWKNGSTTVGSDSNTLDLSVAGNGDKGDTISVSVTASDGSASSSAATDSVTVKNSPPSVLLSGPSSAAEGVATQYTFSTTDADSGETFGIDYRSCGMNGTLSNPSFTASTAAGSFDCTFSDGPSTSIVSVRITDGTALSNTSSITVGVTNANPVATGSPSGAVTQTTQYSDSIATVTITGADVAADTLTASTKWKLQSAAGFTTTPTLPGSLSLAAGVTPRTWQLSGRMFEAPGVYVVRVTVSDEDGGSGYVDVTITVNRENARATWTGDMLAFTPPGGGSANVLLRATIQDSNLFPSGDTDYDAYPGDIRKAKATFIVDGGTPTGCGNIAVALIAADTRNGTAQCNVTLSEGDHNVIVQITDYYRGGLTEQAVIEVARPDGSFITGGGYTGVTIPGGSYGADVPSRVNYGFNVKYNKNNKNLQGHANIIFRAGGRIYQIKANAMDSLGVALKTSAGASCNGSPSTTCWGIAEFRSKANLADVTDPANPDPKLGNLTLQMTISDKGEPGGTDTVGVTLWNGNTLLFSSQWNGAKTVEQQIQGGNLVVH